MTDLTNAIQHGRTRRPGLIDPNLGVRTTTLVNSLVGYWKLDETTGTRVDSLGLNNMTVNGTVSSAAGKVGNAVSIAAGATNGLYAAGNLTPASAPRSVSLWCYITDVSAQHGIASAAAAAGSTIPLWILVSRVGGGSGPFGVYHGGAYRNGTTVPAASTWYHLVYTYASTTNAVELWVNGTREINITAADANTMVNVYLGASFTDYAGLIDEVGVWSRVLTSSEIAQLYNSGAGCTYPTFG